jgi:CrcB protein
MVDLGELIAIACGGALGALARIGLVELAPDGAGRWPWTTYCANVCGALLLGYLVTRLQERLPISTLPRPLLGTGLCGALTTFSALQLELLQMLDRHRYALAGAYLAASVAGGLLAVLVSSALVRRVRTIA